MEINQVLLGVQTMFGDSDIVQTHIQFWGFIVGLFSIILLIITLNLQRIALANQNKVNELEMKVALKEITPVISLLTTPSSQTPWSGIIQLRIDNDSAIVRTFGFLLSSPLWENELDFSNILSVPLPVGTHDLKNVSMTNYYLDLTPHISAYGNDIDDLKFEITYEDNYGIRRYRSIFVITRILTNSPEFMLFSHTVIN